MSDHEQDSLAPKPDVKPFSRSFDFSLDFEKINFRKRPELYRIGRGEEGVLLVEPYTSEISPFWQFEDEAQATESSAKIFALFLDYLEKNDFVGADMARKFLLMGYTRARRYAHHKKGTHKTGRKNKGVSSKVELELNKAVTTEKQPHNSEDKVKAAVAKIFKDKSDQAKLNPKYIELKQKFNELIRQD
ncbi:DUF4385 domain-containing protein [Acinetobacter sp.]|uniref:DUF4385 domain-containing protein n=1 Tax=Acinetobacter sp. TaxID=472 RepID=UPI00388ED28D